MSQRRHRQYYNGRRVSKGEKRIIEFLEIYNIQYLAEAKFPDCNSNKGNSLRFDFFLNKYNLCIEYQGQHHYKPINKYVKSIKVHNQTVLHDNIKYKYAIKNNIKVLYIPYWEYDNIENILTYVLSGGKYKCYSEITN